MAFMFYAVLMVGCFVWATYKPNAPYEAFAIYFTLGTSSYFAKRLIQKHNKFHNDENKEDLIDAERP